MCILQLTILHVLVKLKSFQTLSKKVIPNGVNPPSSIVKTNNQDKGPAMKSQRCNS